MCVEESQPSRGRESGRSFSEVSRACDILPPSGKRSITPPLYTLITRSTYPTSSSDVVGVYLRSISFSPSSGSSRPFHWPSTTPFGAGAKSLKCLPTGRPSTGVASGSTKRNRTVSCEMLVRSPSVTVCRDLLRNLAPRGLPPPPPRIETRKAMERITMTAATRTAGSMSIGSEAFRGAQEIIFGSALGWLVGPLAPLCALQASRCWLVGPDFAHSRNDRPRRNIKMGQNVGYFTPVHASCSSGSQYPDPSYHH